MSTLPVFRIQALAQDLGLTYDDTMEADASLIVRGDEYEVQHRGIITSFSQVPSWDGEGTSYHYEFIMEPRVKALEYVSQSRIFRDMTPKEIVSAVVSDYLDEGRFFEWRLAGSYQKREFVVQYNESDLAFIQRILEDEGIFYFFDHSGDVEKMIFGDSSNAIEPIEHTPTVPYHALSGMVTERQEYCDSMTRYVRKVVSKSTMKDFNPKTPSVKVMGSHTNPGIPGDHPTGEDYAYGAYLNTPDEATRKAKLRAEMLSCGKEVFRGTGIFRGARAGFRFELEHGPEGFDGQYLLTKVTHVGFTPEEEASIDDGQPHTHYKNAFECVPASVKYRPALATPRPVVPGLLTAIIQGPEDKYGAIDDKGSYHAKFHFDRTSDKDDKASRPIRLAQPHAGEGYGFHAPLHKGVEIAIGFVNGDPDRPIALGAVPNTETVSPVTSANKRESLFRTSSGHQIRLDDTADATVIDITTKGKHIISMRDEEKTKEVRIKTTDVNEMVLDDKNKNIRIATPEGAHLLKMDYDKKVFTVDTKYGHKITMDDEAKKVAVQTKEGHILALDDDKKLITLQDGKGKHVFQIDVGGDLISITTVGDMEFVAKGSLNIEAKEINIEAKSGAIGLKAMQDIALDGMNVNVKAKQKVAIEATMDASLLGLNVKVEGKINCESKAGVQNKMTGVMTNVESSAINTVKGAMVMVN